MEYYLFNFEINKQKFYVIFKNFICSSFSIYKDLNRVHKYLGSLEAFLTFLIVYKIL